MAGVVLVKPELRKRNNAAAGGVKRLMGMVSDTRMFEFSKPVRVSDCDQDGVWTHECKSLEILAYADNPAEAWQAFVDRFESTWDSIVQEKDARLTPGAQELKKKYLAVVKSVHPIV